MIPFKSKVITITLILSLTKYKLPILLIYPHLNFDVKIKLQTNILAVLKSRVPLIKIKRNNITNGNERNVSVVQWVIEHHRKHVSSHQTYTSSKYFISYIFCPSNGPFLKCIIMRKIIIIFLICIVKVSSFTAASTSLLLLLVSIPIAPLFLPLYYSSSPLQLPWFLAPSFPSQNCLNHSFF